MSIKDENHRCELPGGCTRQVATYDNILNLQITVGTISSASIHTRSKKSLYVLDVFFGPVGYRTICASLEAKYPVPDDLVGRQVIAALGLPPKRMAGVKSTGLLLAAAGESGSILIVPESCSNNGTSIR